MQEKSHPFFVRVLVEVVNAGRIEKRGTALDAMDDVALVEQQFGEVGAVLAGDAGDECNFGCGHLVVVLGWWCFESKR